jgi:hypothetical protein
MAVDTSEGTSPVRKHQSTPPERPESSALRRLADLLDQHPDLRAPEIVPVCHAARTLADADALRVRLGGLWSVQRRGEIAYTRTDGPVQLVILTGQPALAPARKVA